MHKIGLFLLVIFGGFQTFGQSEIKTDKGFLFYPHFAFQTPQNDLKQRFSNFASIGIGVDYKSSKNILFGIDYDWYYGKSLKEEGTFSEITSTSGQIIDQNGDFSVVQMNVKGNYVTGNVGYLFNVFKNEPNSGILLMAGVGFMQHKIDIVASQVTIPQLSDEYIKGYDKLTYGLATKQFIGYQYLVATNKIHLRAGIEFNQGFTEGRRTWNFNTNSSGLGRRLDGTIAYKFGIIVPVYTKSAGDEEFFID